MQLIFILSLTAYITTQLINSLMETKMAALQNTLALWFSILNIFIGLQNEYHNDLEPNYILSQPLITRTLQLAFARI